MASRKAGTQAAGDVATKSAPRGGSRDERGSLPLDQIDPNALRVVRRLLSAGHEAYLVGGCVRDLYLGVPPKDFDIATSATPEQVRRLFRNSRIIGRRFRLVHVFFGPQIIETSTFRAAPPPSSEGDDPLILHDNEWGTIEDDARRRDFTINGLFFDVETRKIVDFVDGIDDLDAHTVRTIGDPELRFREDPVRMIRAIKFAARLDFTIEPATWQALLDVAPDIARCSPARLLEEIYKLLRGGAARRSFELLQESGLLEHLLGPYMDLFARSEDGALLPAEKAPAGGSSDLLWRHLEALDDYHRGTRQVAPNAVILATLFAPLLGPDMAERPRREVDHALDEMLTDVGGKLGMARRDRELARQILMAQHRMMGPGRRRRTSLVQRQYFHDALIFLGVAVRARGSDEGELARWRALADAHRASRPAPDTPAAGERRGSRRRRGGRKRRKKPSGGRSS